MKHKCASRFQLTSRKIAQKGFSLIELMVVLVIISVAAGVSLFYFSAHQKLYLPDEQALKLIDMLQEARQRSLTQRRAMRVEIDMTDNTARLINENSASTVGDDALISQMILSAPANIVIDSKPVNISTLPDDSASFPTAQFKPSVYPKSVSHRVCTFRFLPSGMVTDAGTNELAANAAVTGATLYIWSPQKSAVNEADIARALTISGTSGMIRMWEYKQNSSDANKWQDSRRIGSYN